MEGRRDGGTEGRRDGGTEGRRDGGTEGRRVAFGRQFEKNRPTSWTRAGDLLRRTGRDSNPRNRCRFTGFRDRLLQPLGHLSWCNSTDLGCESYTRDFKFSRNPATAPPRRRSPEVPCSGGQDSGSSPLLQAAPRTRPSSASGGLNGPPAPGSNRSRNRSFSALRMTGWRTTTWRCQIGIERRIGVERRKLESADSSEAH
jgi:hypothetical protein